MSDTFTDRIERRMNDLEHYLKEQREVLRQQKHLDADSAERAYWHYGYAMALRDVYRMMSLGNTDVFH